MWSSFSYTHKENAFNAAAACDSRLGGIYRSRSYQCRKTKQTKSENPSKRLRAEDDPEEGVSHSY